MSLAPATKDKGGIKKKKNAFCPYLSLLNVWTIRRVKYLSFRYILSFRIKNTFGFKIVEISIILYFYVMYRTLRLPLSTWHPIQKLYLTGLPDAITFTWKLIYLTGLPDAIKYTRKLVYLTGLPDAIKFTWKLFDLTG